MLSPGLCFSSDLFQDQGDFNEGGTDIMSGVTIGECDNFEFKQTGSDASVVGEE